MHVVTASKNTLRRLANIKQNYLIKDTSYSHLCFNMVREMESEHLLGLVPFLLVAEHLDNDFGFQ